MSDVPATMRAAVIREPGGSASLRLEDVPDISIREIFQHHRQIVGAPMGNWQDFLDVTRLVFNGTLESTSARS